MRHGEVDWWKNRGDALVGRARLFWTVLECSQVHLVYDWMDRGDMIRTECDWEGWRREIKCNNVASDQLKGPLKSEFLIAGGEEYDDGQSEWLGMGLEMHTGQNLNLSISVCKSRAKWALTRFIFCSTGSFVCLVDDRGRLFKGWWGYLDRYAELDLRCGII